MTDKQQTAGSKAAGDVAALLRARNPLLWIVTDEEARTERHLVDACARAKYIPTFWDCGDGLTGFDGKEAFPNSARIVDPAGALQVVREQQWPEGERRRVFIMRDLANRFLDDPFTNRKLRNLAIQLPRRGRNEAQAVIIITPRSEVPPELQGHAIVIEWPRPDRQEISDLLDTAIAALPEDLQKTAAPNGNRDAAIDAAIGLTAEEAQATFARSLVATRKIDPATVSAEKRRVVTRAKVLEWFEPHPDGLSAVGGLDALKDWLRTRKAAFTPEARAYGLPAPKGCLMVGVPGCGKSLMAKAISAAWAMPLLRLDMGALKSKYVGDSEQNIRKALNLAETVAPCVLWLDEIEKALAGATQGAADGGVSGDALGAILQWMQDRAGSVFVVATANDVSQLPPELLRKGRFDDLFFVDLPTAEERQAILRAALKAHGRDADMFAPEQYAELAKRTQDFTGAEIAALVPDALFAAYNDNGRELTAVDLGQCAQETKPLAKTASERIETVRKWASEGRARPASYSDTTTTSEQSSTGRAVDFD